LREHCVLSTALGLMRGAGPPPTKKKLEGKTFVPRTRVPSPFKRGRRQSGLCASQTDQRWPVYTGVIVWEAQATTAKLFCEAAKLRPKHKFSCVGAGCAAVQRIGCLLLPAQKAMIKFRLVRQFPKPCQSKGPWAVVGQAHNPKDNFEAPRLC